MNRAAVINIVGLSERVFSESTPHLNAFVKKHGKKRIKPILPALTCSTQSTYLTGLMPAQHGIVGNGWYFRDLSQVWFWRQSNPLVQGEKLWDTAKKKNSKFTCANLFWWFNMYSSADYSVTPRPTYRADGLKLPDVYAEPEDLRHELQESLGAFPLFQFWGPGADIRSSEWIADASCQVYERHQPTLSLIYLPHLDYCLQREGPSGKEVKKEARRIDEVFGKLHRFFHDRGVRVVVLSEYGISDVAAPVPLNRILRERGFLRVREECGEHHFDAGASRAFAVCDHQIAHVYVNDPSHLGDVRRILENTDGVERVLDESGQRAHAINHPRSGELVVIAKSDRWFSYEYWLDERRAPDFARTVDIHRKPGYDPAELFIDRKIRFPKLHIAKRLAAKALGFRYLMDVIPLHGGDVRGSHGRSEVQPEEYPLFLTDQPGLTAGQDTLDPTRIKEILLRHVFD